MLRNRIIIIIQDIDADKKIL